MFGHATIHGHGCIGEEVPSEAPWRSHLGVHLRRVPVWVLVLAFQSETRKRSAILDGLAREKSLPGGRQRMSCGLWICSWLEPFFDPQTRVQRTKPQLRHRFRERCSASRLQWLAPHLARILVISNRRAGRSKEPRLARSW